MSRWQNIPKQDIDIDGDEINVLINSDEDGNNYVVLQKDDVLDLLKDLEA
jgi:hypothetical protein